MLGFFLRAVEELSEQLDAPREFVERFMRVVQYVDLFFDDRRERDELDAFNALAFDQQGHFQFP